MQAELSLDKDAGGAGGDGALPLAWCDRRRAACRSASWRRRTSSDSRCARIDSAELTETAAALAGRSFEAEERSERISERSVSRDTPAPTSLKPMTAESGGVAGDADLPSRLRAALAGRSLEAVERSERMSERSVRRVAPEGTLPSTIGEVGEACGKGAAGETERPSRLRAGRSGRSFDAFERSERISERSVKRMDVPAVPTLSLGSKTNGATGS